MLEFSILVCSVASRAPLLQRLLDCLKPQLTPAVELIVETDNGEAHIGVKRNRAMQRAQGKYVAFIDDDDLVAEDYIDRILNATMTDPDTVGFRVRRLIDGVPTGEAIHSLRNERYEQRTLPGGTRLYLRTPNHLNPIRRSIALQVPFLPLNFGEDRDYAERIRPLLKSEVFIDQILYTYLYRSPGRRGSEIVNAAPQANLPANLIAIHARRERQRLRNRLPSPVNASERLTE